MAFVFVGWEPWKIQRFLHRAADCVGELCWLAAHLHIRWYCLNLQISPQLASISLLQFNVICFVCFFFLLNTNMLDLISMALEQDTYQSVTMMTSDNNTQLMPWAFCRWIYLEAVTNIWHNCCQENTTVCWSAVVVSTAVWSE